MLDRYIRKGWVFATLRIVPALTDSATSARLRSGTVSPIRFRFAAREPIFPLEISSVTAGPSEILLYVLSRNVLVPASPKPEAWENQVNSRAGEQHWIYQYESDAGTAKFLPQYQEPFYLTKHRLRCNPSDMRDVRFRPYDPVQGLRSSAEEDRLEAISFLGRMRPEGALDLVLARLHAQPTTKETFSLLWAMGEIGGPQAEQAALGFMEASDPEVRLEAVEALGRMRARAALPFLVCGLESGSTERHEAWIWSVYRRACFDALLALGDSTCIPELRRMAEKHHGPERLGEDGNYEPGSAFLQPDGMDAEAGCMTLLALAACGDRSARAEILGALVAGGEATTAPGALSAASRLRGTVNSFPAGFWVGEALVIKGMGLGHWKALSRLYRLLDTAPRLRTTILEEAAADPRMPRSGAVVLLGCADTLQATGADQLRRIWLESIREPVRTIAVEFEDRQDRRRTIVLYNHDACAVAYAFARHRRADELERLWSERPGSDQVLEGEIVYAMTLTHDPRFRGIVWEYAKRVWGKAARTPDFEAALSSEILRGRPPGLFTYEVEMAPFDLEYRVRSVWDYLLGYPPDVRFERTLLTDREPPPYLRLAAFSRTNVFADPRRKLIRVMRDELAKLRSTREGRCSLAASIADTLGARLDRAARMLAEPPRPRQRR